MIEAGQFGQGHMNAGSVDEAAERRARSGLWIEDRSLISSVT